MAGRGDGIGIEIGTDSVRGVRLAFETPGRLTAAAEEAISRPGDDGVLDAFVRLAARLGGPEGVPVRLAWFTADGIVRAVDVTGVEAADVHRMARELEGITATTTVSAGARQWLLAVRWDHEQAARLAGLAGRAGLEVAACEPAPIALARAVPSAPMVVRRVADAGSGWTAVLAEGVPRAAGGATGPFRHHPELVGAELPAGELRRLPDGASHEAMAVSITVDELAREHLRRDRHVDVLLTGDWYPPYPPDDARAAARQAVALGAAVAAAGLAGRVRAVEPLTAVGAAPTGERRPWVVERLPDLPPPEPPRRGWWRRLLERLRRPAR